MSDSEKRLFVSRKSTAGRVHESFPWRNDGYDPWRECVAVKHILRKEKGGELKIFNYVQDALVVDYTKNVEVNADDLVIVFMGEAVGYGLVYTGSEEIQPGTVLCDYTGDLRNQAPKESAKSDQQSLNYTMNLDIEKTKFVCDGFARGGIARFANHRCSPNAESHRFFSPFGTRLSLVSTRVISHGEEITIDYNWTDTKSAIPCACDAIGCNKFLTNTTKQERVKFSK